MASEAVVVLRAQRGLAGLKLVLAALLLVFALVAVPREIPSGWVAAVAAAILAMTAAYDHRWRLAFEPGGLRLRRLFFAERWISWGDVDFARVQPAWSQRGAVIAVGTRPGSKATELRFLISRLDAKDRQRLGALFADHGHPFGVAEA